MKNRSLYHTLFLSLLVLVFAGCDSNKDEEPEDILGSFEIEVSGAVNQTISGIQAAFGAATDPQTGITGFGLTLGATNGVSAQGLTFSRKGSRPGNGSHALTNITLTTDFDTLSETDIIGIFSTGTDVFYSSGGTLTITESSDRRIEGTISMTGRSILPNSTDEVTISGSFVALGLDFSS